MNEPQNSIDPIKSERDIIYRMIADIDNLNNLGIIRCFIRNLTKKKDEQK